MKKFMLLVFFSLVLPCCKPIPEAINFGNYYVENNTDDLLRAEANYVYQDNVTPIPLISDKIPASSAVCIYNAIEGTGGHVFPSNFFQKFFLYAVTSNGDSLIYEGVINEDWEERGYAGDTLMLFLVVE